MANITIKEILSSDKISELVDKINFNFDQLLLNGGGPAGPIGIQGEIGPLGPRGTVWFTAADIYTTSLSPGWTGTEEMVNDPNISGYPQYKGDPNNYLPAGLGTFPENSFQIGYLNKQLKDGDLYLQESDDSVNSVPSYDGDIWQFDINTNDWIFTGVNIKGTSGGTGSSALSEWIRESNLADDIIYPKRVSGQDITRISVGIDPVQGFNETHPVAKISVMGDGNELIAFLERSLHTGNLGDGASISMSGAGNLLVQGSAIGLQKQIQLQTTGANIFLDNGTGQTYTVDSLGLKHSFTGGPIDVLTPNTNSAHILRNAAGKNITINILTGVINTINSNNDIVLQQTGGKKIGIGALTAAPPNMITVAGNASIGDGYKGFSAPSNGLIVEGNVGIGTISIGSKLAVRGNVAIGNTYAIAVAPSNGIAVEGSVGIGTSSPARKLHVVDDPVAPVGGVLRLQGVSSVYQELYATGAATRSGWFGYGNTGDINLSIVNERSGGSVRLVTSGTAAGLIILDGSTGFVGLGPAAGITPTQKLDVDGRIRIRGGSPDANKVLIAEDINGNAKWEALGSLVTSTGQGVPTGAIVMWGGTLTSVPTGWQLCDGSTSVTGPLRVQLAAQGYPFGQDGSGRARVPDLRERFIVGAGGSTSVPGSAYTVADTGGSNTVTLIPSEVPLRSHTHGVGTLENTAAGAHSHAIGYDSQTRSGGQTGTDVVRSYPGVDGVFYTNTESAHTHPITGNTSTPSVPEVPGSPHENRPPFFALCFIIKHV
jgi:microcystin-dependent protein